MIFTFNLINSGDESFSSSFLLSDIFNFLFKLLSSMTIFMTFHFLIELLRNKTLSPNFDLLINNKPSFCLYLIYWPCHSAELLDRIYSRKFSFICFLAETIFHRFNSHERDFWRVQRSQLKSRLSFKHQRIFTGADFTDRHVGQSMKAAAGEFRVAASHDVFAWGGSKISS